LIILSIIHNIVKLQIFYSPRKHIEQKIEITPGFLPKTGGRGVEGGCGLDEVDVWCIIKN